MVGQSKPRGAPRTQTTFVPAQHQASGHRLCSLQVRWPLADRGTMSYAQTPIPRIGRPDGICYDYRGTLSTTLLWAINAPLSGMSRSARASKVGEPVIRRLPDY